MKKTLLVLVLSVLAFASNNFVIPNSLYINQKTANKYYNLQKAYYETNTLINLTKQLKNNKKFQKLSYFYEIGKTDVYTTALLNKLLDFLKGEKPYSNTQFNNNQNEAGIAKILKDNLKNCCLNLPQKIKTDIQNSIKTSQFSLLANKTSKMINSLSKHNIKDVLENYVMLFNQYEKDIDSLNIPILNDYNPPIKQKLLKEYRIEANTSLKNMIKIFKKFFNQNLKAYEE
ncbi:hypothetical protein [Caminibacter pacificus]|uniref:Uncharacterized protein n=1 Tax=Caminibacter pacificus TaxID=1424653 RepID=A0AAJ4RD69_9BACT|nr:hypothetical protein [Caminibacter pacificus]QCI27631.1 hypothetical protein C6V80_01225 [Caminibacter pacificus]ROR40194.1 hypothetical protein EDC58_1182 [Caminibacter pacificus]